MTGLGLYGENVKAENTEGVCGLESYGSGVCLVSGSCRHVIMFRVL